MIQFRRWIAIAILFTSIHSALAFYDPTVGRWASRDPIGDEVFFKQVVSPMEPSARKHYRKEALKPVYLFVNSDPINSYDALGLANACGNDPIKCMTCMAWAEGRGAGGACMKAIAQVIWNRSQKQNKSMCDIVAASGQFDAYNPKPGRSGKSNNGYSECCNGKCSMSSEQSKLDLYLYEMLEQWGEEFGGGDTQLEGATYFYSGNTFPGSWGDKDDYTEVSVPGCSMHFFKKN